MDWTDILKRIDAGEDAHTEFKRGPGDLKPLGRAICAFANGEGGVAILGVDDEGNVVGVRDKPQALQERLTSFLQSGCSHPVSARIAFHENEDAQERVLWIEVPRQRSYEPLRSEGRVWVRRERSNVEPSPAELQELYNIFGYVLTEEQAITAASVEDIESSRFRGFLQKLGLDLATEPQPAFENDLLNRGVVTRGDGRPHPTLYGLLAFGKDLQRFPQTDKFLIECVAYDGVDRADAVLVTGEGRGCLNEQVEQALNWIKGITRYERYGELMREDRYIVPPRALREALVNAVAHRDYAILGSKVLVEVFSDRLAVNSPGTLPNHTTPDSVRSGGHPRSRNELSANFLQVTGWMEQRGRGWPVMRRAMQQFNDTEPELLEDRGGRFVRVTFQLGVR